MKFLKNIKNSITSVFNGFSHLREDWLESHRTPVEDSEREFQSLVMRRQWNGKWRVDGFAYEPADRYVVLGMGEAIPDTYQVQTGPEKTEQYYGHLTGNRATDMVFKDAVAILKEYDADAQNAAFLQEIKAKPHDRHYAVMMAAYDERKAVKAEKAAAKRKPKR
ncbi:MAG: hypothetical protein HND56_07455 [Pseudomonadota bacterium]|nr:hypothetical protein [Pseudomonadota bacterium]QKK05528.1 MAG: hypothetical protein HND56_07455 [Pseudomonadota bacterium]